MYVFPGDNSKWKTSITNQHSSQDLFSKTFKNAHRNVNIDWKYWHFFMLTFPNEDLRSTLVYEIFWHFSFSFRFRLRKNAFQMSISWRTKTSVSQSSSPPIPWIRFKIIRKQLHWEYHPYHNRVNPSRMSDHTDWEDCRQKRVPNFLSKVL